MSHPYATLAYAESLFHWGRPFPIPEWNTHVLIRQIKPGVEDACGVYPLAILDENADIAGGLERLRKQGLISVVLVLDDFHRPLLEKLRPHFSLLKPFKTHYLHRSSDSIVYSKHHRYEVKRALQSVCVAPLDLQKDMALWYKLYTNLIDTKALAGLHVFPFEHHLALAQLPGVTAIGAWQEEELVAAHVWVSDGEYVHSHLAASSKQGYACGAAYAVNDFSLRYFSDTKVINLGGNMGYDNATNNGLAYFKKGFANDQAHSYLCGAVLDEQAYKNLLLEKNVCDTTFFFPAYRAT